MSKTELFRIALMEKHSDDWTMEVISEAAHICANAVITDEDKVRNMNIKEILLTIFKEARKERAKENSYRWRNNRKPVDNAWFTRLLRKKIEEL